jgi:sodium transport system permease protein
LTVVLLSAVLLGPMVLIALSSLLASFEAQAERREVVVAGIEHAPGLKNFLERQSYAVKPAPADYETRLRRSKLADAVLVVPERFEALLQAGEQPVIEVISDSGNRQSQSSASRAVQLLNAYGRERGQVSLLMRGVSPELLQPLQVEERDLASTQTRAAQLTGMLPFFVIMAVLYGALNAALDTTAGERERSSLEPLMMTPAARASLVVGKWGAVASLAMLIAVLSCLSFLPAQWLLRSDTLAALFRYGPLEALFFVQQTFRRHALVRPLLHGCWFGRVLRMATVRAAVVGRHAQRHPEQVGAFATSLHLVESTRKHQEHLLDAVVELART